MREELQITVTLPETRLVQPEPEAFYPALPAALLADFKEKEGAGYRVYLSDVVNDLCDIAHQISCDHGFYAGADFNLGEKLALIHSEISEALEASRKSEKEADHHIPQWLNFEVELADAVIRIMDLAAFMQIPLGEVIADKMLYNADRAYKHGKRF